MSPSGDDMMSRVSPELNVNELLSSEDAILDHMEPDTRREHRIKRREKSTIEKPREHCSDAGETVSIHSLALLMRLRVQYFSPAC
jgi:hypothetical protein